MGKKKRYRGQFCMVCGEILANEKFSGKGHAAHICKACAKKPREKQEEDIALHRIERLYRYGNLSRNNKRMLEKYSQSPNKLISSAALEAISTFQKGPVSSENIDSSDDDSTLEHGTDPLRDDG